MAGTIDAYRFAKAVTAALTRSQVLGVPVGATASARDGGVGAAVGAHFRGAIALPLAVRVGGLASAAAAAADGRASGVIPKALASALTSVLIETGRPGREALLADLAAEEDARRAAVATVAGAAVMAAAAATGLGAEGATALPTRADAAASPPTACDPPTPLLEAVITEALRLHPPLLGGCRVAPPAGAPPLVVAGHAVPAGGRLCHTWAVVGDADGGEGLRYMPVLRPRGGVALRLSRRAKAEESVS
ncbi:hypothetical protein I4F81_008089 [Pyropia yezoensis]|uniref:Uncharacterized protein n=1 Tax=Pyropia yezoensis TaxID=2788 RepID=A0ACC3C5R7_PYRYE|nr:hypothetical protein I4F81_008089 [Neopyropia yezoensis]